MRTVNLKCPWCSRKVVCVVDRPNNCPLCLHRADVSADRCDCLICTAARLQVRVTEAIAQPKLMQASNGGVHVVALVLQVTKDGIWRRMKTCDEPEFWFEVFESKGRAIEVFALLWPSLTPEERNGFLRSCGLAE